jgi:hypothetical protein
MSVTLSTLGPDGTVLARVDLDQFRGDTPSRPAQSAHDALIQALATELTQPRPVRRRAGCTAADPTRGGMIIL